MRFGIFFLWTSRIWSIILSFRVKPLRPFLRQPGTSQLISSRLSRLCTIWMCLLRSAARLKTTASSDELPWQPRKRHGYRDLCLSRVCQIRKHWEGSIERDANIPLLLLLLWWLQALGIRVPTAWNVRCWVCGCGDLLRVEQMIRHFWKATSATRHANFDWKDTVTIVIDAVYGIRTRSCDQLSKHWRCW